MYHLHSIALLIGASLTAACSCSDPGVDTSDSGGWLAPYYTAFEGEVGVKPGESWSGDEYLKVMHGSGARLLCTWQLGASSDTPVDGCDACDFAFEVQLTEAEEYGGTRCDILGYAGYVPSDIEGQMVYGYQHGGVSYWDGYEYNVTGALWYRYLDTWYMDPLAYARWTETDPPDGRLYYFYYWISGYYYR